MALAPDKSLEAWIWDAACSIRGAKDAGKYKDYTCAFADEFPSRICSFVRQICSVESEPL